tara:strand:- start:159 stop:1082 length:924 start_codon:yes stop_codon:yes gene_type:complete
MNKVRLRAPATIANLSCGFDIMGVCLNEPYDEITITKNSSKNVIINIEDSPFSNIPSNPKENTGGVPAELIIQDFNLDFGFDISIKKGIPLCGGLGSSAATAAGVVFGINKLLDSKMSLEQLIKYSLEGEKLSSKSPHADNIGPCLMGGLVLIRNTASFDLINIPIGEFYFAIIHPDVKIDTKTAREILPKHIELNTAVKQWGNIASLTYGFSSDNINLIKKSMEDYIIEPVRSKLIPGYFDIKKAALDSGAIGCSISGSGPSIFALFKKQINANEAISQMQKELEKLSIKYHSYISPINIQGIEIL